MVALNSEAFPVEKSRVILITIDLTPLPGERRDEGQWLDMCKAVGCVAS